MATTAIEPYLFFNGQCEEALTFYQEAIGAQVLFLMHFKDSPEPPPPGRLPAGFENKVMHATVRVGEATFMASDGCHAGTNFQGFSLSLALPAAADTDRVFAALADGGTVQMPLTKTFWSPRFGMVADRFGVNWMITVAEEPKGCPGKESAEGSSACAERELSITRLIDASSDKLYRAWTEPELLKQWFTPAPWCTTHAEVDVRPGGSQSVTMRGPNGEEVHCRGVYLEVAPNERLVWTDAYSTAWEPSTRAFMTAVITFENENGKTRYTARSRHWTVADLQAHEKMGFSDGWNKATDQLEALVAKM
jgi:uncharacterized protein YndB with AHSA1/START domain/uncharacterized glyoxalase superfamily protein PhnB